MKALSLHKINIVILLVFSVLYVAYSQSIGINEKLGIGTNDPASKLQIIGGADASLSSHGYIVLGSISDSNLVIDNNGIMVRNNGSISNLYIQNDGGLVSIGSASPSDKLHINSDTDQNAFRVQVNGVTKFRIMQNGGIYIGYNGGGSGPSYALQLSNDTDNLIGSGRAYSWATYSDQRVKSRVEKIKYGLKEIMNLHPRSYLHHNSEYSKNGSITLKSNNAKEDIGFIAQEVYHLIPEIVHKPVDDLNDMWAIDYQRLTPIIIKAIQEQQEMIEELQADKLQLKDKLDLLASELSEIKALLKQSVIGTVNNEVLVTREE